MILKKRVKKGRKAKRNYSKNDKDVKAENINKKNIERNILYDRIIKYWNLSEIHMLFNSKFINY